MKVKSSFTHLARQLAFSSSDTYLLASALVLLVRPKLGWSTFLIPLLYLLNSFRSTIRIRFWLQLLTAVHSRNELPFRNDEEITDLRNYLLTTNACQIVSKRLTLSRSFFSLRTTSYGALIDRWLIERPRRIFLLHHYDKRGYWPSAWQQALTDIQSAGWSVVISTSGMSTHHSERVKKAGFHLLERLNVGRCLGSYKDFSLLLHQYLELGHDVESIVLANDSSLPVRTHRSLVDHLDSISSHSSDDSPALSGLTDSAERDQYHLQSYFLHANKALLRHSSWLRFWLQMPLDGTKDDLIDRGEIGLSQDMLSASISLYSVYPLVAGLLECSEMAEEILRYGVHQPRQINQSLFAWRSLLRRGFPLIKKHVLFDLVQNHAGTVEMADLISCLDDESTQLLKSDIQELFVSRYS